MINPYYRRVLQQQRSWVAGRAVHNDIDDECCPDFSCCCPELLVRDRYKRYQHYVNYCKKIGVAPMIGSEND